MKISNERHVYNLVDDMSLSKASSQNWTKNKSTGTNGLTLN